MSNGRSGESQARTVGERLLKSQEDNHILPFLWVHGETEETYRRLVQAIDEANIKAFCVEARPHKGFCKEPWWRDIAIILDEAEKRGMKVWILDDKHFPTGYAAGAAEAASLELKRRFLCTSRTGLKGGKKHRIKTKRLFRHKENYTLIEKGMSLVTNGAHLGKKHEDDKLVSCVARNGMSTVDLCGCVQGGFLVWDAPEGDWIVDIVWDTRNSGYHRKYINMLDEASCRLQIEAVYEPHYEHLKEKFGTVIAGFFSDEPEFGNGRYFNHNSVLGTAQSLPYSRALERDLQTRLGQNWRMLLPALWNNDYPVGETARVRYIFMDCATRMVENCFSRQIGQWCREHNVEYIGHIIEDNNQHARAGNSLGHYFRALKWQTMAGVDVIGGQLYPGGEDSLKKSNLGIVQDGEFYHYTLAKLGASLGALNPHMQGKAMCEIFGNYGWGLSLRLEKYLLDHFMMSGCNYFVPHAFNAGKFPDRDCPPHFYAHGHNPQYRYFGSLMNYCNRVSSLISGGKYSAPVAILYHAEAEWSGKCMMMQKPARVLWDLQIDFNFMPGDVFSERDFYKTEIGEDLIVNGRSHRLLVIPYSQYITIETASGIAELKKAGCPVAFIDALPEGICTGENVPAEVLECEVVSLDELGEYALSLGLQKVRLSPESNRIRLLHYEGDTQLYYFFNEGDIAYKGTAFIPVNEAFVYDPWNNRVHSLEGNLCQGGFLINIFLEPCKSLIVLCGKPNLSFGPAIEAKGQRLPLRQFTRSVCNSIDYPNFYGHKKVEVPENYSKVNEMFAGYIRYETTFYMPDCKRCILEITRASDGVEVFVNGRSAGIQIVPSFIFDVSDLCKQGKNELTIEVSATLGHKNTIKEPHSRPGISGDAALYVTPIVN